MSFTIDILDFPAPLKAYKNLNTKREAEFKDFFTFAGKPELGRGNGDRARSYAFVIQVCKQIDFGEIYSKRYIASTKLLPTSDGSTFSEITETQMASFGLRKANSYKNFKTRGIVNGKEEELFLELNLYQEW